MSSQELKQKLEADIMEKPPLAGWLTSSSLASFLVQPQTSSLGMVLSQWADLTYINQPLRQSPTDMSMGHSYLGSPSADIHLSDDSKQDQVDRWS